MSEKTRDSLKSTFSDGERPSGSDFGNLIDSFVSKQNDFDGDGNLVLPRGVKLGDSAATVAGGLRFNSNQLQIFTGGAWTNVSAGGGGGGFGAVPTTAQSAVARDSRVGIGNFPAVPAFKLDVEFDTTGGPDNQVRFGNLVFSNGVGLTAQNFAVIAHQAQAALNVNNNYALRQTPTGELHLNAPTNQIISIRQGGQTPKLAISAGGNVIVGSQTDITNAPASLQVQGNAHVQGNINITGDITVAGQAFKPGGGAWAPPPSDARVKEDVSDLELGLSELQQVRTVRFRYNGRGGTQAGQAGVGVLAQEIEAILPETVRQISIPDDPELVDMRVFDASPLTFVLINAVKELAARVEHLERALAATTAPAADQVPAVA